MEVLEQEPSDPDSEKKSMLIDAVLHTSEQRTASEKHVELLKQRGGNAVLFPCSEISSLESKSMDDLSSLHLIVDTSLYRILMDDGYLCAVARRKFKELDKSGKRIHVLNTLPLEFEELFLQIPRNARTRWDEANATGVSGEDSTHKQTDGNLPKLETLGQGDFQVKGPSGGTMGTANVAGTIDGGMGNTNNESSMVVHTARNYQIINQAIGDEGTPSITVEEGSQASSHNWFKITIKNTKQQDQEIHERLTYEKETLKSEDIHGVEIHRGSVIIKLYVDKSRIMTDEWIHEILQKIFHDILKDFFTEETVQVMCERHISMGVEHFLEIYSSHPSLNECFAKVKKLNVDDSYSICTFDSGIACMDDLEHDMDYDMDPGKSMTETVFGFTGNSKSVDGCRQCTAVMHKYRMQSTQFNAVILHAIRDRIKGPSSSEKSRLLNTLSKLVSALRNNSGGALIVHLEGQPMTDRSLEYFDQICSERLTNLLEDGEQYTSVYKRLWLNRLQGFCENFDFVQVEVKGSSSVATVSFNTKLRNDYENIRPSTLQISKLLSQSSLIRSIRDPEILCDVDEVSMLFPKAPTIRGLKDDPQEFQEDRHIEHKSIWPRKPETLEKIENSEKDFVDYLWWDLKLRDNVTSMSKIESGGSVFFGVVKIKDPITESPRPVVHGFIKVLKKPDNTAEIIKLTNLNRKKKDKDKRGLKVARNTSPPILQIKIDENKLRYCFDDKIRSEVTILADERFSNVADPWRLIQIAFHDVLLGSPQSHGRLVVLEVAIAYTTGVIFYDKLGPETYEIKDYSTIDRMSKEQWLKRMLYNYR